MIKVEDLQDGDMVTVKHHARPDTILTGKVSRYGSRVAIRVTSYQRIILADDEGDVGFEVVHHYRPKKELPTEPGSVIFNVVDRDGDEYLYAVLTKTGLWAITFKGEYLNLEGDYFVKWDDAP